MSQAERILLQAIQKSIWKTDVTFPADTDWNAVLKEAEVQAVLGIVAPVAPAETQKAWLGRTCLVTASFVRILHSQSALCALLEQNGIPFVILKGTAAAIYYPDPSQRTMGDIDYLVQQTHFDQATAVLKANEYQVVDDPRMPRHIHVYRDGISFEQHRFFSSEGVEIERYIMDGMSMITPAEVCGSGFPMLPKLANGMVLLGHMVQHMRNGLGLRQVIDWMMFVDRELNDEFWENGFGRAAKEAGLDTAAIVATEMCRIYLGLSERNWCKGADPELCAELMESLLSSGNFDRKRGKGSSVEAVTSNIHRKGLFRYLQTAGEFNWKAYHKHKWLKPFAWLYQIGRYAKQGVRAKRGGSQIKEDIARGKQRNMLLEKLKIKQ